jgi:hypothetical protein
MRCSSFNLNKTKYIMIPRDQIDLAWAARRAEVSRYHDVTELAQVKVSGFLSASASPLVRRPPIRGKEMLCERVQTFDDDSSQTGGKHDGCFQIKEGANPGM